MIHICRELNVVVENLNDKSLLPRIIDLNNNVYPKGLILLQDMFRHSDVPKHLSPDPEPPRVGPTIHFSVGIEVEPKTLYIGGKCTALLREFIDVFAWSYKDLRVFDPDVI